MIRISGGRLRNRSIKTPTGMVSRPTLGKTREAIFNILQHQVDFSHCTAVDLFAGSGALGFEAYSRGVEHIQFVDQNKWVVQTVSENIRELKLQASCRVDCADGIEWLQRYYPDQDDHLFLLDPPYQTDYLRKSIDILHEIRHRFSRFIVIAETDKQIDINWPESLSLVKEKTYGKTRLVFLEYHQEIL